MQENPKGASEGRAITTWEEDEREQWAALYRVLEHHPEALSRDELARELTGGSRSLSEIDGVQRAVGELVGAGLLHPPGADELIRPTRAAVRYFELSGGAG